MFQRRWHEHDDMGWRTEPMVADKPSCLHTIPQIRLNSEKHSRPQFLNSWGPSAPFPFPPDSSLQPAGEVLKKWLCSPIWMIWESLVRRVSPGLNSPSVVGLCTVSEWRNVLFYRHFPSASSKLNYPSTQCSETLSWDCVLEKYCQVYYQSLVYDCKQGCFVLCLIGNLFVSDFVSILLVSFITVNRRSWNCVLENPHSVHSCCT